MMELWIYENHICELRSEEVFEERPSQLYTQIMQFRKERVYTVAIDRNGAQTRAPPVHLQSVIITSSRDTSSLYILWFMRPFFF